MSRFKPLSFRQKTDRHPTQERAGVPGVGHGLIMEGQRKCCFCDKDDLQATDFGISSHLRKHVRQGLLKREEVAEAVKDILFRRKREVQA